MIGFHLRMAWRSLRRTPGVTAVMVIALSAGVGTWYAQHQVFAFIESGSGPTPPHLFHVALEREGAPSSFQPRVLGLLPSIYLTERDAQAILDGAPVGRRTMTFAAPGLVDVEGRPPEGARVRYATGGFFEMFAIPFAEGGPWSEGADAGLLLGTPAGEVVVDEHLARRVFGAGPALGRRLRVDGAAVRVAGVVSARYRQPQRLYDVRSFDVPPESIYLPLAHARAAHAISDSQHVVAGGETGSVEVWVELADASERATFLAHVDRHLERERAAGRAATPGRVTLRSAHEFRTELFQTAGSINVWPLLAWMCLITSVVSLVRVLMAKFNGRSHDLGLLRALGARRRSLMGQLLLEAALVGILGGAGGLLVGAATMPFAAHSIAGFFPVPFGSLADTILTLGASVGAALAAALYPAWRLSRGTPAAQLRRA